MSYSEMTRNSRELLKRVAHASRLASVAKMFRLTERMKILDYGCGDGGLFEELVRYVPPQQMVGFEPYLLNQMTVQGIKTYDNEGDLTKYHSNSFDLIFCTEVCEHLNQSALNNLFQNIRACGKKDAVYIFGVPIETGLSGLFKNVYRTSRNHRQRATLTKAIKSFFGAYIPRAEDPTGWIGSHIGFSHKFFAEQLDYGGFKIVERKFLPWPFLNDLMNNEIYFICERNERYK